MSKICNKCGVKELNWNKKYHEKTGKWKLQDHKNKEGEWCIRNVEKKSTIATKEGIILCEYCKESNFGLCRNKEDYKNHINAYHPKKQILTNLDYMYQHSNLSGVNIINWKSDSHYERYKKLLDQ
tara:strand:+ start:194 stop:568 length:375 start_codon:yes stop_codon:yes gene_type:complete